MTVKAHVYVWDELRGEPYHYRALLACGHSNTLTDSWTPVVEAPHLGPYEGYCRRCDRFSQIRAFVAVPGSYTHGPVAKELLA